MTDSEVLEELRTAVRELEGMFSLPGGEVLTGFQFMQVIVRVHDRIKVALSILGDAPTA